MDVILHVGAHRTATTTFQHYVRDHAEGLARQHVGYWGPQRARKSVFPGLFRNSIAPKGRNLARRAEGRIRLFAQQAQNAGIEQLLVSDENMLGTPIGNLRAGRLYPAAGERVSRVSAAFAGRVRRIVLTVRTQEYWWASAAALTVSRGHLVPSPARFAAIARDRRTWRDVITDLACAAPGAQICVVPFEAHSGHPENLLEIALQRPASRDQMRRWLNRSADLPKLRAALAEQGDDPALLPMGAGRWMPFTDQDAADLREHYADDLHWLVAGADGLAQLTETMDRQRADTSLPPGALIKGQGHDKGHMAQHR